MSGSRGVKRLLELYALVPRISLTANCVYCGEGCRDRGYPNTCPECSDLPHLDPFYVVAA